MSQPLTKKNFVPGSLRGPRTARTLLLRMAADDERAQRFRETYEQRKAQDPRAYTWKRLADHVGISERAVQDWAKTGGVDYDNAKKAAEFWEVNFDWLWRGDQQDARTPDLFAGSGVRLDGVAEIRSDIAELKAMLADARSERDAIRDLLDQQESVLRELTRVARGLPDDATLRAVAEVAQGAQLIEEAAEAKRLGPAEAPSDQAAAGGRRE